MKISTQVVQDLLDKSIYEINRLKDIYAVIPASHCRRRALCCKLLPEISFIEALAAIHHLSKINANERLRMSQALVHYFFLNSVSITACPFLKNRNCLIYQRRFFGCRAYGLWSRNYYNELTASSQELKHYNQKQWKMLGISLPQEIINFQVSYCPYVVADKGISVCDTDLLQVSDEIEKLSKHLAPWHESFCNIYFSDLSFLTASLIFGLKEAIQMKFIFVKEYIKTENQRLLSEIIGEIPDVFAEFI